MARTRSGKGASVPEKPDTRTLRVGRPLQARLIALEKRIGVFSEEQSFAADSRFNHPVVLSLEGPLPAPMAEVFAQELAELGRLGKTAEASYTTDVGPYRVHCISYFHYDGFKVLLYVEHEGRLLAAWKDEEVLHPDSPRTLLTDATDADIQSFVEQIPGL